MTDLAPYQDPLTIQRVLYAARTIAIVGLSKNELRASYFVGYYLRRHGYRVIPVNPRETEILGETAIRASPTCRSRSTSSTSSARRTRCRGSPEEAVAIGAAALWCQFGVINDDGARIARTAASR